MALVYYIAIPYNHYSPAALHSVVDRLLQRHVHSASGDSSGHVQRVHWPTQTLLQDGAVSPAHVLQDTDSTGIVCIREYQRVCTSTCCIHEIFREHTIARCILCKHVYASMYAHTTQGCINLSIIIGTCPAVARSRIVGTGI